VQSEDVEGHTYSTHTYYYDSYSNDCVHTTYSTCNVQQEIMCSLKSGHCNDDVTSSIQNLLIYGSVASFVYKCFLPGPIERLKKLRFVGRMSDQYNVIIFPSIIYLVLIATHKYKPQSRAWVRGCLNISKQQWATCRI